MDEVLDVIRKASAYAERQYATLRAEGDSPETARSRAYHRTQVLLDRARSRANDDLSRLELKDKITEFEASQQQTEG